MNRIIPRLYWGMVSRYRTELMGIACIWVMFHHNFCEWPRIMSSVQELFSYGSVAVDIFFFLSGIGLYYAWQKNPSLGSFYGKRLSRVLIPYFLLTTPYWFWRANWAGSGNFWLDLTQLSFPLYREITTWYIPVIVLFYLLYPLIERFLNSGDRWIRTTVLCISWMVVCVLFRNTAVYYNCEIGITRLVIFILGCSAGKLVCENRPLPPSVLLQSFGWLIANWAIRKWIPLPNICIRFSFVPLALSVICILIWALSQLDQDHASLRFFRFFGERSLELYLSHILIRNVWVHYWGNRFLDPWGFLPYGVILLCSIAVSTVAHHFIARLFRLRPSASSAA